MVLYYTNTFIKVGNDYVDLYFDAKWEYNGRNLNMLIVNKDGVDLGFGKLMMKNFPPNLHQQHHRWDLDLLMVYSDDPDIHYKLKGVGKKMLCSAIKLIRKEKPPECSAPYVTIKLEAGNILGLPKFIKDLPEEKLINYYKSFGFKLVQPRDGLMPPQMEGAFKDINEACKDYIPFDLLDPEDELDVTFADTKGLGKITKEAAEWITGYLSGVKNKKDKMLYRIPISVDNFFHKSGLTKLSRDVSYIYRGLNFDTKENLRKWWNDSVVDKEHTGRLIKMKENGISSWSDRRDTAEEFADGTSKGDGTFKGIQGGIGVLLRYKGNINNQLYADFRPIRRYEGEILLKPGILECEIDSIYVDGETLRSINELDREGSSIGGSSKGRRWKRRSNRKSSNRRTKQRKRQRRSSRRRPNDSISFF